MYQQRRNVKPKIPESALKAGIAIELNCSLKNNMTQTVSANSNNWPTILLPQKIDDTQPKIDLPSWTEQFKQLLTNFRD